VPGHLDGWSHVQFSTLNPFARADAASATTDGTASHKSSAKGHRSMRSRVIPISAATLALVLAGGTAAFAHAHKTVTLDVDGEVTDVTTFAGSVEGLLDAHDVTVGSRDDVSASGALNEGADVVVEQTLDGAGERGDLGDLAVDVERDGLLRVGEGRRAAQENEGEGRCRDGEGAGAHRPMALRGGLVGGRAVRGGVGGGVGAREGIQGRELHEAPAVEVPGHGVQVVPLRDTRR
jgi:hypothetical protein